MLAMLIDKERVLSTDHLWIKFLYAWDWQSPERLNRFRYIFMDVNQWDFLSIKTKLSAGSN